MSRRLVLVFLGLAFARLLVAQVVPPASSAAPFPHVTASYVLGPNGLEQGSPEVWRRAKPTADGGLVLIYRDSVAHVGPDGRYVDADSTAGLDAPVDVPTGFDARYRLDSAAGVLYFRSADGHERAIHSFRFPEIQFRGEYIGATPLGVALVVEHYLPYRGEGRSTILRFVDSTGLEITAYGREISRPSAIVRLADGVYFETLVTRTAGARTSASASASVLPWWALTRPSGLTVDSGFCAAPRRLPVVWPRVPALPDTLIYTYNAARGIEYFAGRLGPLGYEFPVERRAFIRDYVDSLVVTPICSYDEVGVVELRGLRTDEVASYTINDRATLRLDSLAGQQRVAVQIVDQRGCEAFEQVEIALQVFGFTVSPACADESTLGRIRVRVNPGSSQYRLGFDDPAVDSTGLQLRPGSYPIRFSTREGCSIDTVVTIPAIAPALLAIDSLSRGNGAYTVSVTMVEARGGSPIFGVSGYALSGGAPVSYVLPGGQAYEVVNVTESRGVVCVEAPLVFRLGDGLTGVHELAAPDLRAYFAGDGGLVVAGMPASAKTCRVFDALGRECARVAVTGPEARVGWSGVLPKGAYVIVVADARGATATRVVVAG